MWVVEKNWKTAVQMLLKKRMLKPNQNEAEIVLEARRKTEGMLVGDI